MLICLPPIKIQEIIDRNECMVCWCNDPKNKNNDFINRRSMTVLNKYKFQSCLKFDWEPNKLYMDIIDIKNSSYIFLIYRNYVLLKHFDPTLNIVETLFQVARDYNLTDVDKLTTDVRIQFKVQREKLDFVFGLDTSLPLAFIGLPCFNYKYLMKYLREDNKKSKPVKKANFIKKFRRNNIMKQIQ